jgi:hypothetical protein
MISINSLAQAMWNKGSFALKPISVSDDNTTLTIQFFWQAQHEQIKSTMNLLTRPPSTRDLEYSTPARDYFSSGPNLIRSGDLFVIRTDNAQARPLPSTALLEQWFLQRVIGMAGAADLEEDIEEEPFDLDDEISNLGLAKFKDISFLSNDTGPSDPAVSDLSNACPIPTTERPKHETEEIGVEELVIQHRA